MSVVGAVSPTLTVVPPRGTGDVVRCTQYVSPLGERYWCTSVCPDESVRAVALSQSLPTAMSSELLRVVVNCRVGAPVAPLFDPTFPTAFAPFVPVESIPLKLMTVMLEVTFCDRVAFTDTLVRVVEANARQISDVPN